MKKTFYGCAIVIILIFNSSTTTYSQTESSQLSWPQGLGIANQLEYSYNVDGDYDILENWLNLDFSQGIFSAGLRLDVFEPNDPDPSISRGKNRFAEFDFKYVQAIIGDKREGLEIIGGNYYTLFGRGMVLKSYEDRAIRVDNNLLGVKVTGKYAGFYLTGLSGMAANINNERKDILHAVDLDYRNWKWLKLGATVASNFPPSDDIARTTMASVRMLPSFWNIDMYAEYTAKFNEDILQNNLNGSGSIVGEGFYGNLNFYFGDLSLLAEYKYYDNFAFYSQDGTIFYNTPPSVRLEYTYILPNRHPSPLNANNETGYQVIGGYNLDDHTYFTAGYSITNTLSSSSYYQRINQSSLPIATQLEEVYLTAQRDWDYMTLIAAFAYNQELATDTRNITPILESRFYFGEVNTIKVILEHQHSTDNSTTEEYYTDVVTLEYLRSPNYSVALVTEMKTTEPETDNIIRKFYGFVQGTYKIGGYADISLLIGSRQAGNICIGGVCRYEPAFKGVELKLLTRL
jgi:hypothetical protein